MKDFYLIFRNLTRKPLRLFLTLFATFIAFMIFGALTAFQDAFDSGVDLAADDRLIVVNKINFTQTLPFSYLQKVRAVDGVSSVTTLNWFGGYYQDPKKQMGMFAVDVDSFLTVYDELIVTPEERAAWSANRQGLIAGRAVAQRLGWKKGERIPVNSNIFSQRDGRTDWDFDVVAIYDGAEAQTDTNSVYFHYKYFSETQSFGGNFLGFLAVRTASPDLNETVISEIDELFVNSPAETETVPEKAFNKAFIDQIGNLSLILTSVVLAAFFVILVIVGNSMALSIRERTGEIGVMKTLGFTSMRIFKMVIAESLLVALIGGVLGTIAAIGLVGLANNAPFQLPTLVVSGGLWGKSVFYMILLGLITGIVPAISALRMNIISALSRN
ncbi:MAG: ABC transporter permease [Gammaproteobacteria bacterium]